MADFNTIDPNIIKVGDPITKEILDFIKYNFDNHEERLNGFETTGGAFMLFNGDIALEGLDISDPYVFYYKAHKNMTITDFRAQIFSKDGIVVGHLSADLQKSIDTNNANFNTILTSQIDFNYATDAAYSQKTAVINSGLSTVTSGSVLRVEITAVPANFVGKLLLVLGAE